MSASRDSQPANPASSSGGAAKAAGLNEIPLGGSPLSPEQMQLVAQLASGLTPLQQAWVSGYLAASANAAGPIALQLPTLSEVVPFTILFGTETGNAKGLAQDLASAAQSRGLETKLVNMADYKPAQLKNEKFLAIVVATHGEGDPPEGTERLHEFLVSKKAPKLDGVKIAVVGLGDSSYEFFCQTALDFEERLTNLGASVVFEKALFDIDYDDHAPTWLEGALSVFEPLLKKANEGLDSTAGAAPLGMPGFVPEPVPLYTKKNPYLAEVAVVQKVTGRDSIKDVRHIEIMLGEGELQYRVGDALGVYFLNDDVAVAGILDVLELDPDTEVSVADKNKPLHQALLEDLELTLSYPGFVERYAQATGNATLTSLVEDKAALRSYIEDRQIYDVIHDHPEGIEAQTLVDCLRKIQPRSYSIASSQLEVEDEVHLTVATVEYDAFGREHLGGASGYLCRRIEEGTQLRVYVESNDNFRLPDDPDTPIIMIGPGTGIAPFRAFLQERDATEAGGDNWLFFGNPNFTQDFLYQLELQSFLQNGLLTRLNVAFSRDQASKVYVQHRIVEEGAEVFAWLERGAHVYVCGDMNRMAKDVHDALLQVIVQHGDHTQQSAEAYLDALREQHRYQKDVY